MLTIMPATKRWTRQEYHDAASAGVFQNQAVQLIKGEILVMSPMDAKHAAAIRLTQMELQSVLSGNRMISVQLPLALGTDSEPEPDLSVVAGNPRDFTDQHPSTAELVVEVSLTTLAFDQTVKRRLYAAHEIPEYWILNLKDRQLEIHRQPSKGDYTDVSSFSSDAQVTSDVFPGQTIVVAELLP